MLTIFAIKVMCINFDYDVWKCIFPLIIYHIYLNNDSNFNLGKFPILAFWKCVKTSQLNPECMKISLLFCYFIVYFNFLNITGIASVTPICPLKWQHSYNRIFVFNLESIFYQRECIDLERAQDWSLDTFLIYFWSIPKLAAKILKIVTAIPRLPRTLLSRSNV